MKGFVIWLTGLPAAGKTTLARELESLFRKMGRNVEVLDGDEVRRWLSPEAGFSKEDRERHIMRVAYVSKLLARNGVIAIVSLVSPYRSVRRKAKELIGEDSFVEVYVKVSLDTAIKRDPKGLYKRALRGEIKDMTGIQDPYEEPEDPDVVVDTEKMTVQEEVEAILNRLRERGLLESF